MADYPVPNAALPPYLLPAQLRAHPLSLAAPAQCMHALPVASPSLLLRSLSTLPCSLQHVPPVTSVSPTGWFSFQAVFAHSAQLTFSVQTHKGQHQGFCHIKFSPAEASEVSRGALPLRQELISAFCYMTEFLRDSKKGLNGKMAQRPKADVTKPGSLSVISCSSHMAEGKSQN